MCLGALAEITPEVSSSLVREGDTLLLCSDGLWGQIDMEPLITELSQESLSTESLKKWTEQARISKVNNSDNITLVAAKFINKSPQFLNPLKVLVNFFKNLRLSQ
jgi:serine/threonine protein phosphatase PrpC